MFQIARDKFRCDGGETKSTPSLTDLDCTVRLDWSLGLSGTIWGNMRLSLAILEYMGLYGIYWEYLGLSGNIWEYLGLSKTI